MPECLLLALSGHSRLHLGCALCANSGHCAATLNAERPPFGSPSNAQPFISFLLSRLVSSSYCAAQYVAPDVLRAARHTRLRIAVSIVAGTTRLNAAAKPRSEKAPRREIISDLIFSLITTSGLISKASRKGRCQFDAYQRITRSLYAERWQL